MMCEGGARADSQSHSNGLTMPVFGAVLDASPDAVLDVAGDGSVTLANAAAERLFGFSRHKLAGRNHRSLFAAGFRGEVDRLIHRLVAVPGEHPPPREVFCMDSNGTEFSAEVAAALLPGPASDGQRAGAAAPQVLLSIRGTSHRAAAEEDLREAMSLLAATLESTADGILVMSNQGHVAGFNDQFPTMWGIPPELLEGDCEEPIMRLVVSQLADPLAFMGRIKELEDNPAAESHDVLDSNMMRPGTERLPILSSMINMAPSRPPGHKGVSSQDSGWLWSAGQAAFLEPDFFWLGFCWMGACWRACCSWGAGVCCRTGCAAECSATGCCWTGSVTVPAVTLNPRPAASASVISAAS